MESETRAPIEPGWGNQAALRGGAAEPLHDEIGLDLDSDDRDEERRRQEGGAQEPSAGLHTASAPPRGAVPPPRGRAPSPRRQGPAAGRPEPTAQRAQPADARPSVEARRTEIESSDPAPRAKPEPHAAQAAKPEPHAARSERADADGRDSAASTGAQTRRPDPHAARAARPEGADADGRDSAASTGAQTRRPEPAPAPSRAASPDRAARDSASDPALDHAATAAADRTAAPAPGRDEGDALSAAPRSEQTAIDGSPSSRDVPGFVVDNGASSVDAGQLRKTEFLDSLELHVTGAANDALRSTLWSADGCPWIAYWFSYYRGREVADIERAIRRFAPEARGAKTAADYVPFVTERVRSAVRVWARTGETQLPEGLPATVVAAARAAADRQPGSRSPLRFKARTGGAQPLADAGEIADRLGAGASLPAAVRARMEPALGQDLSAVRIHTDATAAELSERMNAHAFTVGNHVAFGLGEYRPGTPMGDALLAHELAHVVQQRGASQESDSAEAEAPALEEDADRAAKGVVQSLWSRGKGFARGVAEQARPRLRSGLSLRACSSSRFPSYSQIVGDAAVQRETDAAWASTKAATTAAGRREEGFWIQLDMSSSAYRFVNRFTGPTVGPGVGGSATPGTKPADSGSGETGTYTVGLFHTHTPTTHRPVGRGIGPSTADENFHNSNDVVGVVYDYEESPAGSGNIPAGHPLHSAARRYHSGPDRRSG